MWTLSAQKIYQTWNYMYVKLESVRTLLKITRLAYRKSYLAIIGPNSHEKLTKYELGLVTICSNLVLSTLICPQNTILSIFRLTYLHLPLFTYVWHNLALIDQIWFPRGKTSDSDQCSNRLQLDLISLLVNFSWEWGQIMTRYDFLGARRVILSHVQTVFNVT